MIPILYDVGETTFTHFGLGPLSDAAACTVTEERNGEYTMTMQYPTDGAHYGDIVPGSPIRCLLDNDAGGRGWQLFRVVKINRPIGGLARIECQHVSYQLSLIPVNRFTAFTPGDALNGLITNAAVTCPFTYQTNKSNAGTFAVEVPSSFRSRLGGSAGSVLDVFGGEYEFDNFNIKLWASRGSDRGVTIRYGLNLTDLKQEESIANTVTGVYPYWAKQDEYVDLPEEVIMGSHAGDFPFDRVVPVNFSGQIKEKPTEAQLRTAATAYVANIGVPAVNLTVKFVNLADCIEYSNPYTYPARPIVRLCDTVTVIFDALGISKKAKIIKTVWNVLAERYDSIEVGDIKTSLADTIAGNSQKADKAVSQEDFEDAVAALETKTKLNAAADVGTMAGKMAVGETRAVWLSATTLNALVGTSAQAFGEAMKATSNVLYLTVFASGQYVYLINYNISAGTATYKMLTAT